MNICYLHLEDLTVDSAPNIHVREIINNLARKNTVFLLLRNGSIMHHNVKISQISVPRVRGINYLLTIFYSFMAIRKVLDVNKIDVIYCRDFFSGFSAILISKMKKIPFVFEVNGILSEEAKIKKHSKLYIFIIKIFERFVFRNSDAFICVTEKLKRIVKERYDKKNVYYVPNGVNTDLFKPIKNAKKFLKFDEDFYYVVFVGSFAPWQGLDILIKSAPEIVKSVSDTRFLIIGDDIEKKALVARIADLSLQDIFIFVGRVAYTEVSRYINACDICTIPKLPLSSGYSPLKLYEYMACEKPVIASKIEGFEILEQNNAGILVKPESPKELSKAIIKLLKNEELRREMSKNGRKYVVENHSWKKITERIEEILKKVHNE